MFFEVCKAVAHAQACFRSEYGLTSAYSFLSTLQLHLKGIIPHQWATHYCWKPWIRGHRATTRSHFASNCCCRMLCVDFQNKLNSLLLLLLKFDMKMCTRNLFCLHLKCCRFYLSWHKTHLTEHKCDQSPMAVWCYREPGSSASACPSTWTLELVLKLSFA